MRKLSRIIAAHMEVDTDRADELIGLIHDRLCKRAERAGKKLQSFKEGAPDSQTLENAIDSSAEVRVFDAMVLLLEELLEDVDMSELDGAENASKKKAMN